MKVKATIIAFVMLQLVACGDHNNDKANESQKNQTADQVEISKLKAELPQTVLSRVPMVNGQAQFDKVEVISVEQSVDASNPAAVEAAFKNASVSQKIGSVAVADSLDESSSEQFHGNRGGSSYPYARNWFILPWRRHTARALQNIYNPSYNCGNGGCGGNNYGISYPAYNAGYSYSGGCCQSYQPTCGGSQSSFYQYSSFQMNGGSNGTAWNGGW